MKTLIERNSCPSCYSAIHSTLIKQGFDTDGMRLYFKEHYEGRANIDELFDFNYELVQCTGCGLVYQNNIPSEELLSEIYDQWIPESEQGRLSSQYSLKYYSNFAEEVIFIIRYLNVPPSEVKILDFGLGWSNWANMARAFGCSVRGTELSTLRCKHAESIGIPIIDYYDINQYKFNFINTEQVFEHLINPRDVLEHLVNSLEPNGIIKISVPDIGKIWSKLVKTSSIDSLSSSDIMPIGPLEHVNCFSYKTLVSFADQVGLKPIPFNLSLLYQLYNSATSWLEPREMIKQGLRPLYRYLYPKSTFLYFSHKR